MWEQLRSYTLYLSLVMALAWVIPQAVADVGITDSLDSVTVTHQGKDITIRRNQDRNNKVNPAYAWTSRECPPFCIQPMKIAEGVETIGELEMLNYLKKIHDGNNSILVIDSRTPDWVKNGTIPGSVNIPWTSLKTDAGADPFEIADILKERFGVSTHEGLWDFSNAKTLVLFCNGMWCGQSPSNINTLLDMGYPANKLKWYRGGMQDWEILGLTTVK
ncbi:MAG: rhodanese-like domain-containing protein [Gammaproteobacteria bacterium]|nr:rhodanese-like domain-containing protein [Gammaproteobacteria bacterium]NIO61743.1 rhodanese-like domain-containing protein [Gammaproteobacteria bacterium]NIQ18994.1 rhodanese-like domain-containing protein [Gammaproteobacteria bacterium]NIT05043.1 rhodanese-like domain-containing protein [Gammaproteobacteria bacterium]NIT40416.1 rhodanese-like domain-containing protein [Gammaproteobacteria bacterium]